MLARKRLSFLVLFVFPLSYAFTVASEFYVAPDGRDTNAGTQEAPFASVARARDAVRARKRAGPLPHGGITVWIRGGVYRFDTTLALTREDSGTAGAPIAYRACVGENVVFDGSRPIDVTSLHPVEEVTARTRLCPAARGHVLQSVVADESVAQALASSGTRLSIDGRMMQLARFPNVGYCHIDKILDKGAIYAHGRTMGDAPKYSMSAPVGGVFTIVETPSGDWESEFKRVQKAEITGYLSYDWYRENHKIAAIRNGAIQLLEFSRYGVLDREKVPRRLVVRNLLCELDQPGEWYFDQVESRDLYGSVRIRGVGNLFQNNLVHNFVGQPITIGGNDHVLECNEIFNVGIEEGDGGAVYSGAQMWSHGNLYRHNFLHHLMCVPQAHPRGGIYPDDLDGGDTVVGNVFYKAAHRAVLLNGGAAHVVKHNVFIDGHIGVYSTEAWAQGLIEAQPKYDSGELKRGDKNDHLWRTEQVVGKEGWNRPPWSTKYPLLKKVMNQPVRRYYPIECTVSHNLFCGNHQNTAFRRGWGDKRLLNMEDVDYIDTAENRNIPPTVFVNPAGMDFHFKKGLPSRDFPEIPFDRIGLYVDEYRAHVPDKAVYRRALKAKWDHRKSYDEQATYDPKTVNELIYLNTGKLLIPRPSRGHSNRPSEDN